MAKKDVKRSHTQRERETSGRRRLFSPSFYLALISLLARAPDSGVKNLLEYPLPCSDRPIENGQLEQVSSQTQEQGDSPCIAGHC